MMGILTFSRQNFLELHYFGVTKHNLPANFTSQYVKKPTAFCLELDFDMNFLDNLMKDGKAGGHHCDLIEDCQRR